MDDQSFTKIKTTLYPNLDYISPQTTDGKLQIKIDQNEYLIMAYQFFGKTKIKDVPAEVPIKPVSMTD